MNLDRFVRDREGAWAELEGMVARAKGRPERLGPAGILRLGRLYRSAAADLALARRRFPGDPVVARVAGLVTRARPLVYGPPSRRRSLLEFFGHRYWALVRERPVALGVAAALLLAPALAAGVWGIRDPVAASGMVPGAYRSVAEPRGHLGELSLDERAALSSFIFTNNIRVSFLAFAGGIVAGLLTAYVLAFNGAFIGVIAGLAIGAGNGSWFFELVAPHGALELSCIVVTAAAGLRVGSALIDPGRRRRFDAVVAEGRAAVEIVLGTVPWFVLAGLVEGFVTPTRPGLAVALSVGLLLAAVYWAALLVLGAPRRIAPGAVTAAPSPSL